VFFGSNIKILRKRRRLSQEHVAEQLGVKRTSLSGYENGSVQPPFEVLIKVSEYFKVSIDKLVKYDFATVPESQLSQLEKGYDIDLKGNKLRILATSVNSDNEENIELIPQKVKAGYTAGYSDPEYIRSLPVFNLPFLSDQRKYRAFPISGDSMPPVSEGSYVIGEYVVDWTTIKDGTPYIILTKDDGIVFKIVYNHLDKGNFLQLCSTNSVYEPYTIQVSEVIEMWKFVNYIGFELAEMNLSNDTLTYTVLELQRDVSLLKSKLNQNE